MKELDDLIAKLKKFEEEIYQTIENILRENDYIIIDMNVEDQLFEKGIDRTGTEIASYAPYSPVTIQIKRIKGQPTNRVTLRDAGDFHHSFYIEFGKDSFEIKASDWKTQKLIASYGQEILGLTDYNFKILLEDYVAPAILKILKEI
jgi:hypothetical protein